LEEIQVPVLIITGALDVPDFVALSELLEDRIPDVERIVVPDAAHMVSMECPQRVAEWISEFVEAH
jgi:pimeloyl-ACP methyl ester carboxylesterase